MFDNLKNVYAAVFCFFAILLCAACGGCTGGDGNTASITPDIEPAATIPPQEAHRDYVSYNGQHGETITVSAEYANTVNGYFKDRHHKQYILENNDTKIVYDLSGSAFTGLGSLENNSDGRVYLTETMDTYVKDSEGKTFYSGGTFARANLYDLGLYYYNLHLLDQFFLPGWQTEFEKSDAMDLNRSYLLSCMEMREKEGDGSLSVRISDPYDPFICFSVEPGKYDISGYDAFAVTLRTDAESSTTAQLFYKKEGQKDFSEGEYTDFNVIADGDYHTYIVGFRTEEKKSKNLTAFRIDIGSAAGESVQIKDVSLIKFKCDIPMFRQDRSYHMFPDRVHECVRFIPLSARSGISAFGMITKIPAESVASFVVSDSSGQHDTLENVDWSSAYCVGFDIKNAGVFGIILGTEEKYAGKLNIRLNDGYYVLSQELDYSEKNISKRTEIYLAHRLYTDGSHDFSRFLKEAYNERNPVDFIIDEDGTSDSASFLGYDQLTGRYMFRMKGIVDFDVAYENPLQEHKIKITAVTDSSETRVVYICGETRTDGYLESAVVLDENDMLLPVSVEVCKNFGKGSEDTLYEVNSFGYSLFPLCIEKNGSNTVTLANLYEQWGNYRLKQLSSIRWLTAYYHLSLGVTETNCINIYNGHTNNYLPDHRGLSAPYWSDEKLDVLDSAGRKTGRKATFGQQPQHSNNGDHSFMQYTDSSGSFNYHENVGRTVISSAGPDLADITLHYLSWDGKVYQKLRHTEMPSTDENRTYYILEAEFLDDVTIDNVLDDFSIYKVSGNYGKFGYLDKNNKSVIVNAEKGRTRVFELGSDHPYFDYFGWITKNPNAYTAEDVCSNLSFLLDSCEITISGEKYEGGFAVVEGNNTASFTLNISGGVTFRKGDVIRLKCILMPWGYYFSENDENVRIVRENTLLNPIKLEAENGTAGNDAIVPSVRSSDGISCKFTVSGGSPNVRNIPGFATAGYTGYKTTWERDYNITIRAEGFNELAVPEIYELIDGEWVEYKVASSLGYDGYSVSYAADGKFTYGFVITMTSAQPRTFRVNAGSVRKQ